jgi:hypothetical protein
VKKVAEFKKHLKEGRTYRRAEMAQWSNAVDRHIGLLLEEGFLEKVGPGMYHVPKKTVFGAAPPEDESLVRVYLKDDEFLLTSPNAYNSLGVGTTQLYSKRVVYNRKQHGEQELGGKKFYFHFRPQFPKKLTTEFLLVDLVNNLKHLAEDTDEVMKQVVAKIQSMDKRRLRHSLENYGNTKTKAMLRPFVNQPGSHVV